MQRVAPDEPRKRRASERHVVGCCDELAGSCLGVQNLEQLCRGEAAEWKMFVVSVIRPDWDLKRQRKRCECDVVLVSVGEHSSRRWLFTGIAALHVNVTELHNRIEQLTVLG